MMVLATAASPAASLPKSKLTEVDAPDQTNRRNTSYHRQPGFESANASFGQEHMQLMAVINPTAEPLYKNTYQDFDTDGSSNCTH
mmetsp:Transcript_14019/g.52401  ORF Transcript_14019/g.52401 Transcript_14019/m.52401 type:complete len:85 (+) Transcript_14019:926-1180(+)|eukprot:scaffold613_cov243-Pinguiococcus_pyrenoidosus.AAC.31